MNNKITLYTASNIINSVDFLVFNENSQLLNTLTATQNADAVWQATFPALPEGKYTVVGKSGNRTLGKEDINWNGEEIVQEVKLFAEAVREELTPELVHLVSMENGLTESQSIMLLELYRVMGLDPTRPLYVDLTSRKVLPEIVQQIDSNNTRTIMTRK